MKEILEPIIKVYEITPDYIVAKVNLQVSAVDELPTTDEIIGNIKCGFGSIAQAIQEGKFCTRDENGNWYSGGEAATNNAATAQTMQTPKSLGVKEDELSSVVQQPDNTPIKEAADDERDIL